MSWPACCTLLRRMSNLVRSLSMRSSGSRSKLIKADTACARSLDEDKWRPFVRVLAGHARQARRN
eukprot:8636794-Pyramimonas_sp.AAC.1